MGGSRHNYQLNSATVLRDVYRLACMVMADKAVMSSSEDERSAPRNCEIGSPRMKLVPLLADDGGCGSKSS